MSRRRGLGKAHWRVVIDGTEYMHSNLSHAVPVLRELGVRVSASRLYNEYRDQVERAHGLPNHRSYPRASPPTQHPHQLQEYGARRAISPAFISSPALPHQHHAQPRRQIALFAKCARACMHGSAWMPRRFTVGVR